MLDRGLKDSAWMPLSGHGPPGGAGRLRQPTVGRTFASADQRGDAFEGSSKMFPEAVDDWITAESPTTFIPTAIKPGSSVGSTNSPLRATTGCDQLPASTWTAQACRSR